jgi:hypothetical protein
MLFTAAATLILLISCQPSQACTLWAANGNDVRQAGSLIVKNRDWAPDHRQELRLVSPERGYKYFGLFAVDGEHKGLKAGINEKGLVVVSATAGSIPSDARKQMPHTKALNAKLLAECGGVDDVLAKTDYFRGPQILMIADREKIAFIEIGPERAFAVSVRQNGSLYHTNHYIADNMQDYNYVSSTSSHTRLQRIDELLASAPRPFDLETFIDLARDQHAGPDNSIFRTGSTSRKTRTLATWAVRIPPSGSPELYVRILNPGEKERVVRLFTDEAFAGRVNVY